MHIRYYCLKYTQRIDHKFGVDENWYARTLTFSYELSLAFLMVHYIQFFIIKVGIVILISSICLTYSESLAEQNDYVSKLVVQLSQI